MKIILLKNEEQRDYNSGCFQITAETEQEAFYLGCMFQRMVGYNLEVARGGESKGTAWIRVPVLKQNMRIKPKENDTWNEYSSTVPRANTTTSESGG